MMYMYSPNFRANYAVTKCNMNMQWREKNWYYTCICTLGWHLSMNDHDSKNLKTN